MPHHTIIRAYRELPDARQVPVEVYQADNAYIAACEAVREARARWQAAKAVLLQSWTEAEIEAAGFRKRDGL